MDWKVAGYIIGNLLKHKEVGKIEDLKGNIFTSFDELVCEYGENMVRDLIYSVIDIAENNFGEIKFGDLQEISFKRPSKDGLTPAKAG